MVAMGFAEILILVLVSGGMTNADLVALIPPQHYFEARQIELTIDKMAEFANKEPKDAKTQIMQLTALRYLADESAKLKKAPKYQVHRQMLEQIAQGKQAQDTLGFAKEYAARVLMKLDGTKATPPRLTPLRQDALDWFPADINFAAAGDLRRLGNIGMGQDPVRELVKMMPDDSKKEMYNYIEQLGNIRIDRIAFGMTDHDKNRDLHKIYIRVTGKANGAWLAETLKTLPNARPRFEAKEIKDDQGTPITLLQRPGRPPVIAIVGNTDLLMVGYQRHNGKHEDVWEDVQIIRAKKRPSATTRMFKDHLAKIPDKAIGFFVGDVPSDLKRDFDIEKIPVPAKVVAYVERAPMGIDVKVETMMANADEAGKLVRKVAELRKLAIKELQQAQQNPPPGPAIPFAALINLVESVQVQNQDGNVQMRALVGDGLIQQSMSAALATIRVNQAPPLPKN